MKQFNIKTYFVISILLLSAFSMGQSSNVFAQVGPTAPDLGAAGTFGVLAGTFTNSGASPITGDVGYTVPPGVAATVSGHTYTSVNSSQYANAESAQATAISSTNQTCTYSFPVGGVDLATDTSRGGTTGTYTPGVYCITGAASTGTGITLSGDGIYIFKISGALNSVASTTAVTLNGVSASKVFWLPNGLTTLGATGSFAGTILDPSGITIGATTNLNGRALAFAGTVTTSADTITVPGFVPTATLNSIAITHPATKLSYNIGDSLNIAGLVVNGTYSNGTSLVIPSITTANVTGFSSVSNVNNQLLTIHVGSKTATYTISVGTTSTDAVDLGTAGTYVILSGSVITNNVVDQPVTGDTGHVSTLTHPFTYVGSPLGSDNVGAGTVGTLTDLGTPLGDESAALAQIGTYIGTTNTGMACTTAFPHGAINLSTDTSRGTPIGVYTPGVYCIDGAASIGTAGITLNGAGQYVFKMNGALTSVDSSNVILSNGADASKVFWAPIGAATLGANTSFQGTILTGAAAITIEADSNLNQGRLISESAVTINGGIHTIAVPGGVTTASITLHRSSGPVGQSLIITGTGFTASHAISFTFNGNPITPTTSVTSDSTGAFTATITVPSGSTAGDKTVAASDGTRSDSNTFTVTTVSITLSTLGSGTGSTVTVTGSGFIAGSIVTTTFQGTVVNTAMTDGIGAFTATFKVPSTALKGYTITSSDGTNSASKLFSISSSVTLTPTTGLPGSVVKITGTGFAHSSLLHVSFNGVDMTAVKQPKTTVTGTFSVTITVPKVTSSGDFTITAADTHNTASATFTVKVLGAVKTLNIGTASNFAVLGYSTVTNTGSTVIISGDLGLSPGTSVTGFPPGIVVGTKHVADTIAAKARADATTAYNTLSSATCTTNEPLIADIGGQTLSPGVYCFPSSAAITGTLTLNGDGVYIFKISSTLVTASSSSVALTNGASASNVFWRVGSSATLGTGSSFKGTIIALASDTATTGVTVEGRLIALNGAVTMDTNQISLTSKSVASTTPNPTVGLPGSTTRVSGVSNFAVLGSSTVTNTGNSVITGDLGVTPGTSITGFPPGTVSGTKYAGTDVVAVQARADATTAFGTLSSTTCTTNYPDIANNIGGKMLTPGVYCFPSSAAITGTLTLNGDGVYIFKMGSTLVTASGSKVVLINGASASNVFWAVGSSATLATGSTFKGTIIALASVSAKTGASVDGRLIALTGAVTMDNNRITTTSVSSTLNPTSDLPGTPVKVSGVTNFAVLGSSTVTNTGNTVITGDLGLYPGSSITGFPSPGHVTGTTHTTDTIAAQARIDAYAAYNSLSSATCTTNYPDALIELGGSNLTPGVYCFPSSAQITGTLTLNGTGTYIFKMGSTLVTASASHVALVNGASASNVFWAVGSSATLGTTTDFKGTIIALASVAANTGATVQGRLIALTGAVTMDNNQITTTSASSTLNPTSSTPGSSVRVSGVTNFAVLGSSTVTNTGSSVITGDLGLYPGTSITGYPPGIVAGITHKTDTIAAQARTDAYAAYSTLSSATCTTNYPNALIDLGGQTLSPGVYCFPSSAAITGTLTLSGDGVYIFKIGSTIVTASSSSIVLTNGASASNVFWQVGSSATLATSSSFKGTIIALASVTANTGATVEGRLIALTGAVTMDTNTITVTSASSTLNPTFSTPGSTVPVSGVTNFAVLGYSTVTNTGSTNVTGDLGLYPGSDITGFPPGHVTGITHITDTIAAKARADATTAYGVLSSATCTTNYPDTLIELGGKILTPGVYCFPSSAAITGTLTLNGTGTYIFQIGSTLVTAAGLGASHVALINGASASNVFWQVGSSATIETGSDFKGTIIALASVSAKTGATIQGRLIALNGAVTMDNNQITTTSASSTLNPPSGTPGSAVQVSGITNFAVLGYSTVTNTGNTAVITGDIGVTPGTAITGFPPGTVNGTKHTGTDVVAVQARADATTAYNTLSSATCTTNYPDTLIELGGKILKPGVYCFPSSAGITGTLTLSGSGVYIFKMGSTLVTAAGPGASHVVLTNGASAPNVFWRVGSSATLGTYSDFKGTIIALASIAAKTGASVDGRLIALNGAVTMDNNRITTTSTSITINPSSGLPGTPVKVPGVTNFAVLGASTVTNTGSTIVTGDLGLYPGSDIVGFPPGHVTGATHTTDKAAAQGRTDAVAAYNAILSATCTTQYPDTLINLGGHTLTPGVYCFPSSAGITGTLTLSGSGVYIFKIGSTLVTAAGLGASNVVLTNGASASNVFWAVGSSATIETYSHFKGTIIALASVSAKTGAAVEGRLIALTGAVTMDTNTITTTSASITLTTTSGLPGSSVRVSGSGFASNSNLHFTFNGITVSPSNPTSTKTGTFSAVITNPTFVSGPATITVTDSALSPASASATYTVTVPAVTHVNTGTTNNFVVLGSQSVTNTGSTTIIGDLGVTPGSSITGFPPGNVTGATHRTDPAAAKAHADATTTYNALKITTCTTQYPDALIELGGLTLSPGVYCFPSSAGITGTLTLSGSGVYIFNTGTSLVTAAGPHASKVVLTNGASASNVFWAVGSSATLGTYSDFKGTIIANIKITADTGATVQGRLIALTDAVVLDSNQIIPTSTSTTSTLISATPGSVVQASGANNFAVLGYSTVTNTGPTVISIGNLGIYPGTDLVGFPPGQVITGTTHIADKAAAQARADATATYIALASTTCTFNEPLIADIGGQTLSPGVYCFPSSAAITGTLTLNGAGTYIFKMGSTLVTAAGLGASHVALVNGASSSNVFWAVGSSATIETGSDFKGTIIALASVSAKTGATIDGRLIALNGAVTMDNNQITTTTAAITLTPTSGPQGTVVQVSGVGFAHASSYTILYNGISVTPSIHKTSATGTIAAKFTVPSSATGSYTVTVTDSASGTASASFFKLSPSIFLSQSSGSAGTAVSIQGFNFVPLHKITVTSDAGTLVTSPLANTDSSGTFVVTFIVPDSGVGPTTITASDGTSNSQLTFTITP